MTPAIKAVQTSADFPNSTEVVIIGGGIVGLTAALTLAERGIPVVLLEKGKIAAEQSSRNLGWVRKMGRSAIDIPLALAADKLWEQMPQRLGAEVGYKQAGIMYIAKTEQQMAMHQAWLESIRELSLDSHLLTAKEIDQLVPGGKEQWAGGIFTPSDGKAEPTLASSAIASTAIAKGAIIVEDCAVRTLALTAGKVSGVVTERGEIKCSQVLLAGGLWSRRFLANLGVSLPILPLICTVLRTKPMQGPTEIAVGAPNFSFRKHQDGGFIITQRGALDAPLTLDHILLGMRYVGALKTQREFLRISLNKYSLDDLRLSRSWKTEDKSPFELRRTMDPVANEKLNKEALDNLKAAWPIFEQAQIAETWAGVIDITPDSNPVIAPIKKIPGLTIATGFSGHGFGTSPAAGQLAADLVTSAKPIVDPSPYNFERFK